MSEPLPTFAYHPDPVATGAVKPSEDECRSCGRRRGYIYCGPVYSEEDLENALCPWCIADGSAATRFEATFADDHRLVAEGIPPAVVEEVTCRTPSFDSWQGEVWLTHCGDVCEFRGDLPREQLERMDMEGREELSRRRKLSDEFWAELGQSYSPGGDPAIYVFTCRRCRKERYHMDSS